MFFSFDVINEYPVNLDTYLYYSQISRHLEISQFTIRLSFTSLVSKCHRIYNIRFLVINE